LSYNPSIVSFVFRKACVFEVFLAPRTVQQVATLPFVRIDGEVQVLLITSRRRRRWIVPKGWPAKHLSLPEAAAREAEEEAGVFGPVQETPVGSYDYLKRMPEGYDVRCHVFVYPLLVHQHRTDWDERAERRLRWRSLPQAARTVDDAQLALLLRELAAAEGAPLLAFLDAVEAARRTAPAGA
jgi:8-oxo-dGTP pyrophosphatase MutT (NUDIX family)